MFCVHCVHVDCTSCCMFMCVCAYAWISHVVCMCAHVYTDVHVVFVCMCVHWFTPSPLYPSHSPSPGTHPLLPSMQRSLMVTPSSLATSSCLYSSALVFCSDVVFGMNSQQSSECCPSPFSRWACFHGNGLEWLVSIVYINSTP